MSINVRRTRIQPVDVSVASTPSVSLNNPTHGISAITNDAVDVGSGIESILLSGFPVTIGEDIIARAGIDSLSLAPLSVSVEFTPPIVDVDIDVISASISLLSPNPSVDGESSIEFSISDITFVDGDGTQFEDISTAVDNAIPAGDEAVMASFTPSLPAGVTFDLETRRFNFDDAVGVPAASDNYELTIQTQSATDWASLSSEPGLIFATDFSEFADRASFVSQAQAWHDQGADGANYFYTGSDGTFSRFVDPIPSGSKEKVGLNSAVSLSGGQSLYLRLYEEEGPTESGPVVEFSWPPPYPTEYYFQFALRIDAAIHNYDWYVQDGGNNGVKFAFINQWNFAQGQIVATFVDMSPFVGGYRVDGTSKGFRLATPTNRPFGIGSVKDYSFYDTNPGAPAPTTESEWQQRYGPHRSDNDWQNPDYANVPKFLPDEWMYFTAYVNANFVGAQERGMVKFWLGPIDGPATLVDGGLVNVGLDLARNACESVRVVLRPESEFPATDNNPAPPGADGHGFRFDHIRVGTQPITSGGFPLPYPGTEIPPDYPPPGMSEN